MKAKVYVVFIAFCTGILAVPATSTEEDFTIARTRLIQMIAEDVKTTATYLNKTELNPLVLNAMAAVPRHEFVPEAQRSNAYLNRPLPIGYGQTISQPYIVAIMTDLLQPKPSHRILEIGTGSGYQAAILAELVSEVYTVEIVEPLYKRADKTLTKLQYKNVTTRYGDGYYGWKEHAPFDAIIVTAAASHVPPPLLKQLKTGGRMIIPVGSRFLTQELLFIEKTNNGEITTHQIIPVVFVPLTGKH